MEHPLSLLLALRVWQSTEALEASVKPGSASAGSVDGVLEHNLHTKKSSLASDWYFPCFRAHVLYIIITWTASCFDATFGEAKTVV
jgi:hypothetical protein